MRNKLIALVVVLLLPVAFSLACGNHNGMQSSSNSSAMVIMTGHIVNAVREVASDQGGCPAGMSCPAGCSRAGANVAFYNDADHQVYVIFIKTQSDLQHKVSNYLQKHVEITAVVHKDASTQGVEIQTIKDLGAKGKS